MYVIDTIKNNNMLMWGLIAKIPESVPILYGKKWDTMFEGYLWI